jgi:hypothetical protein
MTDERKPTPDEPIEYVPLAEVDQIDLMFDEACAKQKLCEILKPLNPSSRVKVIKMLWIAYECGR